MVHTVASQASRWLWMHCLSPLHVGTGEGIGVIDMPIQREKVTEWPMIPGSSLKGVQRNYYRTAPWSNKAFGQEGQDGNAGALVFSDGRILAFPVASRFGTFAYVTCPLVLRRLKRDAQAAGLSLEIPDLTKFDREAADRQLAWVSDAAVLHVQAKEKENNLFLDEFAGNAIRSEELANWAKNMGKQIFPDDVSRELWEKRVVLVSDASFQYFTTMCCEVVTRIRMNEDTKTVSPGALWTEEYVPAEAIFYGLIWCDRVDGSSALAAREEFLGRLEQNIALQMGGNTTLGKGRMRCRLTRGDER